MIVVALIEDSDNRFKEVVGGPCRIAATSLTICNRALGERLNDSEVETTVEVGMTLSILEDDNLQCLIYEYLSISVSIDIHLEREL